MGRGRGAQGTRKLWARLCIASCCACERRLADCDGRGGVSRWVPAFCLDLPRGSRPWTKRRSKIDCSARVSPREAEISLRGWWEGMEGLRLPSSTSKDPSTIQFPPVGLYPQKELVVLFFFHMGLRWQHLGYSKAFRSQCQLLHL